MQQSNELDISFQPSQDTEVSSNMVISIKNVVDEDASSLKLLKYQQTQVEEEE